MGTPRARLLARIAVAAVVLLAPTTTCGVAGHSRALRPGGGRGQQQPSSLFPANATRAEAIERQFVEWVRYVGGLRHSTFQHAVARASPSYSLVVDKDPALGDFTTIQAAVDSLPAINLVRVVIRVNAGTYTEKVTVSAMRAFITLEGAGADKTVVQWGDTADSPTGPKGRPLGTFNSASFAVNAQYFLARNITFKFWRWRAGQNTSPVPKPGAAGKQAVALRVSADNAAFVGCRFLGAQDTLYDHSGRHYYKDCYIQGSVDFIFGNALSLYEDCHVHAIARDYGALTAQNRQSMLEDTGFSFVNCRVTGSGALYLGRAWGTFSRVVFAYTHMDDIIVPNGWFNWGDPNRELTVFYGQYKCTGPGATYAGRVAWSHELTDDEAKPFISLSFIDGTEWVRL
ncbi:pectinesterase precursor [Zea mays]|uniref:Pectinesterase n=1 Tax=Zea mays TaxID=4577 RepID=C0HGE0_MAIZE|nr:pectinesterase precursor [Zea mays]ACN26093.1 unknown [Zea mays]ONM38335.1 Pectinesterase [Zea mays]|eukprot:NP_001167796.1 pectinesterase precursor [Zea mays]